MPERISSIEVAAYRIPTDGAEADGTLAWDATTIVVVQASGGGHRGLGYSYTHAAAARLIADTLGPLVVGGDAMAPAVAADLMLKRVRNLGHSGIAASAMSAVDIALWDLKARLLDVPLVDLLGQVRGTVPVYGSGGFTSYSIERLTEQLAGWVARGIGQVKMKVGSDAGQDAARVHAVRAAIGAEAGLFVDANGAYDRKLALEMAARFRQDGVTWLEEPVSSDDVDGLRLLRDRAPAGMDIAAGEYGYSLDDFRRLLDVGAVDVLQLDATRCGGVTGFRQGTVLARAHHLPVSSHTAPSVHAHLCCAEPDARHIEYFHDHVRIESLLFDGVLPVEQGAVRPAASRPGLGLVLRGADAGRYRI